jgi:hypothetical protein
MTEERKSRGLDTRAGEKKENRNKYNMGLVLSTDIPERIKRPGFTYYWERMTLRGQTDSALDFALRRGWKPVPIDRDPERFNDILERNPLSRKYICQGDVILLEREEELSNAESTANADLSVERLVTSKAYNFRDQLPQGNYMGRIR